MEFEHPHSFREAADVGGMLFYWGHIIVMWVAMLSRYFQTRSKWLKLEMITFALTYVAFFLYIPLTQWILTTEQTFYDWLIFSAIQIATMWISAILLEEVTKHVSAESKSSENVFTVFGAHPITTISYVLISILVTPLGHQAGVLFVSPVSDSWVSEIFFEYLLIKSFNDIIAFRIIHPKMHDLKTGWYKHHKKHHIARKNTVAAHNALFSLEDIAFEAGTGVAIVLLLKMLFGCDPSVHQGSVALLFYGLMNVHSSNPYACTFPGFPVLDCLIKGNVAHVLHHALVTSHFEEVPWEHLFNSKYREDDILLYNKTFGTAFEFYELFPRKEIKD